MKFIVPILLLLTGYCAVAQPYSLTGNVVNEQRKPVSAAIINMVLKDGKWKGVSNKDGAFLITGLGAGRYGLSIDAAGKELYTDSVTISTENVSMGTVVLREKVHMLDEVKIAEKVMAMVQKDDTLEYNSGAFKVNPDADAADLIKKMPSIDITDKKITAQGETVVKILVDGKPFLAMTPMPRLKICRQIL